MFWSWIWDFYHNGKARRNNLNGKCNGFKIQRNVKITLLFLLITVSLDKYILNLKSRQNVKLKS